MNEHVWNKMKEIGKQYNVPVRYLAHSALQAESQGKFTTDEQYINFLTLAAILYQKDSNETNNTARNNSGSKFEPVTLLVTARDKAQKVFEDNKNTTLEDLANIVKGRTEKGVRTVRDTVVNTADRIAQHTDTANAHIENFLDSLDRKLNTKRPTITWDDYLNSLPCDCLNHLASKNEENFLDALLEERNQENTTLNDATDGDSDGDESSHVYVYSEKELDVEELKSSIGVKSVTVIDDFNYFQDLKELAYDENLVLLDQVTRTYHPETYTAFLVVEEALFEDFTHDTSIGDAESETVANTASTHADAVEANVTGDGSGTQDADSSNTPHEADSDNIYDKHDWEPEHPKCYTSLKRALMPDKTIFDNYKTIDLIVLPDDELESLYSHVKVHGSRVSIHRKNGLLLIIQFPPANTPKA